MSGYAATMRSAASQITVHGTVRGSTIDLDEDVKLDGKRVTVKLIVDDPATTPEALEAAWAAWVSAGEQGPICDDDDGASFP